MEFNYLNKTQTQHNRNTQARLHFKMSIVYMAGESIL